MRYAAAGILTVYYIQINIFWNTINHADESTVTVIFGSRLNLEI